MPQQAEPLQESATLLLMWRWLSIDPQAPQANTLRRNREAMFGLLWKKVQYIFNQHCLKYWPHL
jgi:hypothetical protein